MAPEGSDAPMAVLLRQERARLEREAIAAGLDYRGMSSGYTDSRVRCMLVPLYRLALAKTFKARMDVLTALN